MQQKSLVGEIQQLQLAMELIELGARLQVLECETDLSRGRLIKLYKEVRGASPPKGMLPFSADWFMTWRSNIHSSLFYNFYRRLRERLGCNRVEALTKAYRLYLEQMDTDASQAVLDITRAWTLLRFFESDILDQAACTRCGGRYIVHAFTPDKHYVCGICQPPSRAGKPARGAKQPRNAMQPPCHAPSGAPSCDTTTTDRH